MPLAFYLTLFIDALPLTYVLSVALINDFVCKGKTNYSRGRFTYTYNIISISLQLTYKKKCDIKCFSNS